MEQAVKEFKEFKELKTNDVLKFVNDVKITTYKNTKSKGVVTITLTKGTQIVVRGVNKIHVKFTVINGEYKGEHFILMKKSVCANTVYLGNAIIHYFGDDAQLTNKKPRFKHGDVVIYAKSYTDKPLENMIRLNSTLKFIGYLKENIYEKKLEGVPFDCILEGDNGVCIIANSNCLKLHKKNCATLKHEITVKVKNNRVKYMDKVGNDFVTGVSVCDNQDEFNLRTGLLLAIARAYKDKALEDFALDNFKY